MYNWADSHSAVRCCSWFILITGLATLSWGQVPGEQTFASKHPQTNSIRVYEGWTRSQPARTNSAIEGDRSSYYQQFEDPNYRLPTFPEAQPTSAPSSLQTDGGALVNSLSDIPVAPLPQDFGMQAVPIRTQSSDLVYENSDLPGGTLTDQPSDRFVPQYAISSDSANLGGGKVVEVESLGRVTPVTQAAYQSGQGSVMPPTQVFPSQQQYLPPQYAGPQYSSQPSSGQQQYVPQQQLTGGTQLRQSSELATGLPYVTPPPSQRYPTSPYTGRPLFMNAAYQRTTTVSYPNQASVNPGSVLPQNIQPNQQPVLMAGSPGVYPTAYPQQCAPSLPPSGAVGASVPPTITPNWNPNMYSANNSGYRPVISMGQENYNVVLGRGLFGQPTVYVPGQCFRNFLRYIFP